jgi:hypothetical protein
VTAQNPAVVRVSSILSPCHLFSLLEEEEEEKREKGGRKCPGAGLAVYRAQKRGDEVTMLKTGF